MLSKTSWCDKPWFLSSYLWIMELMDLIYTLPIMPYSENHKDALQTAVIGGEIWQHVQPWVFWSSRPAVVVRSSLSTHVTLDIRCVVHQAEHVVFRPMWHWCVCVCVWCPAVDHAANLLPHACSGRHHSALDAGHMALSAAVGLRIFGATRVYQVWS